MYRINLLSLLILALFLQLSGCVTVNEGGGGATDFEKASKINVQLGIGYYNRGNLELANEKLLKAIRQDPKSSQAYHAYAVLQNRFLDPEKAEFYFKKSIELNPRNSEALNNYGAFLCSAKRIQESETMFLRAIDNQAYRSPEVAYTSAAVCLLKEGDVAKNREKAIGYLRRALAIGSNYRPALINMAAITLEENNNELTRLYLERFNITGNPTARSLWLSIQNDLAMGDTSKIGLLTEQLENDFSDSEEYKQWLALDK